MRGVDSGAQEVGVADEQTLTASSRSRLVFILSSDLAAGDGVDVRRVEGRALGRGIVAHELRDPQNAVMPREPFGERRLASGLGACEDDALHAAAGSSSGFDW